MNGLLGPEETQARVQVSVGICAYNEEGRVGGALRSLLDQELPAGVDVSEILVVASGCTDGTEAVVETWSKKDPRIVLVHEPTRQGKASSINAFLARARGDLLVLLNGDARLPPNSLSHLLEAFLADPALQIACGLPVPEGDGAPLVRLFAESQWGLHNRTLETISRLGLPNHCCDEFLAMRRGLVSSIPPEIINDGAYLGVVAAEGGHRIRVCPDARVFVEIPRTLRGALVQRRRILRGHRQIRELLRRRSSTLEGLLFRRPSAAMETIRAEFLRSPEAFLRFALLLIPLEGAAMLLAGTDRLRSVAYEPAWTVVD